MSELNLHIEGFKCYKNIDIPVSQLTVLSGANSAGKSSILQAITLLASAAKAKDALDKFIISTRLNSGMDLGIVDEIFYSGIDKFDPSKNASKIEIQLGSTLCDINLLEQDLKKGDPTAINVHYTEELESVFKNGFSYISANRWGPHWDFVFSGEKADVCGVNGQLTAQCLFYNKEKMIDAPRCFTQKEELPLLKALNEWSSLYIFPDIEVDVNHVKESRDVRILYGKKGEQNKILSPTSVGYGLSYALPILIEGLLLPKNSIWLVENPEAHLQPKAQVQMGFFLSRIAAAGVRVIIETHSEYILKGISAALTLSPEFFKQEDIAVLMCSPDEEQPNIQRISITEKGISKEQYPSNFFDYNAEEAINEYNERISSIFERIGDIVYDKKSN